MNEQRVILSRLLDKYERSKHLLEPGASNRRVMLSVSKKELPEYQYETAAIRDAYNAAVIELERQQLVTAKWFKDRPVLLEVVLNLSRIGQCYCAAGRVHPKEQAARVITMVSDALADVSTSWIAAWRDEICSRAETACKVPPYCRETLLLLADLVKALSEYDQLAGESVTMRAFSNRCYHDTKHFERAVRDLFLRTAQDYCPELSEACEQSELGAREQLAFLGIYARPELYELSGDCAILTQIGKIDVSAAVPYGLALPSTCIDSITGIDLGPVNMVTFIENKTNYDEYILAERSAHELVLFHGGFLSPQKKTLFSRIADAVHSETVLRFWADIDLGGFQMFSQLQRIVPQLQPMRMSGEDVERFHTSGFVRNERYLERLGAARRRGDFPLFTEAIDQILKYGVTIEQEAFLQ